MSQVRDKLNEFRYLRLQEILSSNDTVTTKLLLIKGEGVVWKYRFCPPNLFYTYTREFFETLEKGFEKTPDGNYIIDGIEYLKDYWNMEDIAETFLNDYDIGKDAIVDYLSLIQYAEDKTDPNGNVRIGSIQLKKKDTKTGQTHTIYYMMPFELFVQIILDLIVEEEEIGFTNSW